MDNTANTDWCADVAEFMKKFGQEIPEHAGFPDQAIEILRMRLLDEEFKKELKAAWKRGDLVEIADALGDLIYVAIGMAWAYGIDLRPIFREIHKTNMAKEGGATRADGKILKPAGWKPPEIKRLLIEQGMVVKQ